MVELHFFVMLISLATIIAADQYALLATANVNPVDPPSKPIVWQTILGGIALGLTNWPFLYAFIVFAGWMFVWGDNSHIAEDYIGLIAGLLSALIGYTSISRTFLGRTPRRYWPTLWRTLAAIYAMGVLVFIIHPENLTTVLTVAPILLAVGGWGFLYRNQLRSRQLSLFAILALATSLSVGLALTVYLRG